MYLSASHYVYFFLTLAGLLLAIYFIPSLARRTLEAVESLSRRGFSSSVAELPKFALLRVALGLVLAWRAADILWLMTPGDFSQPVVALAAWGNFLSGLLLVLGLGTQWSFLYLLLVQWQQADWVLGTSTLGNDVAAILSLLLLLTNAGRYYSLDSVLIRRFSRIRPWLLYYAAAPSVTTITNAKLLALFSYWLVCLYSLSMHLNEQAWMTGVAGPQLLSNNFMSHYYAPLMHLFEHSELAVHVARLGLWLMLPWYLCLLPAVLAGGWLRRYAIVWAILFFTLSKFVLQLGWLAEIEFLLWTGLFWSVTGISRAQSLAVAFDDTCNLCDRTVQFVRATDLFNRVELRPASKNVDWLATHGISYERAMDDLHGIDLETGRIDAGYEFYIALSKHVALLWPLYPMLLLFKWIPVGPVIYRWTASRRKAIFGVCSLPSQKPAPPALVQTEDRWQVRWTASITLHVTLLGFFYVLAIPAPYMGHAAWRTELASGAHMYGITPINVFNQTDLRMMENWFTLHSIDNKGATLVPVFNSDGERLAYHRSDRIYFGITLVWRRVAIGSSGCLFENSLPVVKYLTEVDLSQRGQPAGDHRYRFTQYFEPIADAALARQDRYVRGKTTQPCTVDFTVTN